MLKLDVGIPDPGKPHKKAPKKFVRSLSHFKYLLSIRNLPEPISEELFKIAQGYPEGALDFLYNNLETFIQKHLKKNKPQIVKAVEEEPQVIAPEKKLPVKKEAPQVQRQSLFASEPIITHTEKPIEEVVSKVMTEDEIFAEMMKDIPRVGNPKGDY
jgi:hypothetical protein